MDEEQTALLWAIRHLPPSPEVVRADQAHRDLADRLAADGYRSMNRDEQRLARHYRSTHEEYTAKAVEAFRSR